MNEGHSRDSTKMQSDEVLQNGASVRDSVKARIRGVIVWFV